MSDGDAFFFFLHSYVVHAALTVPTERFVDVTVLIVQDHMFDIILSAWCSHKNIKYGPLLCSFSAQPNRLVRVPCFFFMFVGCYRMLVIEQLMKSSLCVWLCLCVRHLLIHSLIHQPGEAEIHYGTRLGSDVHMFHVLRWTEQRDKIEKKSRKNEKGYD